MNNNPLSYAVSANQNPIQVGPDEGASSLLTLVIVVSNNTRHIVDCKSIEFSFLQGTNARDLFANSTGISTNAPTGWKLKQSGSVFTAKPVTPEDGEIGADGVVFTISNIPVNTQPGTTPLTITEETIDSSGSTITATQEIDLAKFPQGFFLDDLTSDEQPPIDFGGSVTLRWKGTSGASYVLQYQDKHDQTVKITETKDGHPLPSSGSYTADDLEKDTTFSLWATLSGTGQDNPPRLERFLTVQVNAPQPVINSFKYTASPTKLILRWETSHADTCTITGDPHPVNLSSTDHSYFHTWPDPNVPDGIYTLTATTSAPDGGNSVSRTIHTIPVIKSFKLSTTVDVDAGSPLTLSWDTDGAESVTITPDIGQVSAAGSVVVRPLSRTTWILTCTGFGPDVSAQPITVGINPPIITSNDSVQVSIHAPAGTYTLNWSVDWQVEMIFFGTVTNSMTITTDGSPRTVAWNDVFDDKPWLPDPPEIIEVSCTITPSGT